MWWSSMSGMGMASLIVIYMVDQDISIMETRSSHLLITIISTEEKTLPLHPLMTLLQLWACQQVEDFYSLIEWVFLISSIIGDRCPELNRAIQSVRYIAAFTKEEIENNKAKEDWKFVAMVLDRLFLWIFSVAVIGKKKTLLLLPWFCSDNWQINPLKLCNSMIKLLHFDPNYVCFTTFLIWSQIKSLLLFNQKTFL